MKKQSQKKNTKWVILACLVVVLAVAAALMLTVFGGGSGNESQATQQTTQSTEGPVHTEGLDGKLYWNVDGATYRGSDIMVRPTNSEDGFIYIQFAVEGEQVRLPVADRTLANKIDMMEIMGLVFNADGVVVDAVRVEDFTGGLAANSYYVTAVEGNVIKFNSAVGLDGFNGQFILEEGTKIWDVGGEGLMVGLPGTIGVDDEVIAIKDVDGKIDTVFVKPYKVPGDVYFISDRKYDSATKRTTRERDVTGNFVYQAALNGEEITLKVRDVEIASQMDAQAARCFGVNMDEEGNIMEVIHAGSYTGGGSAASWYHLTAIDGNEVSFRRVSGSGKGNLYTGKLAREYKVYDVSGTGEWFGQPVELKVGQQCHCLLDSRGQVYYVFVVNNPVESEIYWNVERKYDSKTKLTTRTPDYDGWYRIKVAVLGQQKIVKTQDPDIVQKIDARAAKCFGLKLDGDVIEKFYTPEQVSIGGTWASWYDVTALEGDTITVFKESTGDILQGTIAADCETYNVASNAALVGQVDKVRVGDRVHTLQNLNGEVCVIFIVNRYENLPVYWNISRKYNSTTKLTTRVPDADGYYVFEMAHNGEIVTVKTKSQKIATDIDSQAAKALAMEVYDGIVYRAIHPSNCTNTKGGGTSSWTYVTGVSNYGFTTEKISNGVVTKTYNETKAWNCKIYNVSTNFIDHRGEETKLQVGDFVHCLADGNKNVTYVFVMERYVDYGVYYNLDRMYDSTLGETTRVPDADGVYTFRMAHDGQEVTVKTKDKNVANAIDLEIAKVVGIDFDDEGYAIHAMHAKSTKECKGGIGISYATVTKIEGNQVTTNKDGSISTWTISDEPNVFNVTTDKFETNQGERTKLQLGDHIHCLKGADGTTNYVYVLSRINVMPEGEHICEHVTEDVTWYAWDGVSQIQLPGYYYLTGDTVYADGRITINGGDELTICLNGHTITSEDRFFNIYGTLNICDHKADGEYQGKISGSLSCPVDANGKTTATYGGLFYMYNSSGNNPVFNLYGGILEHTGKVTNGGIGYLGNSSDDKAGLATMNIYDGTLQGASTYSSGAGLQVGNGSVLNMYGGTITGCTAAGNGGAISVDTGTFNMEGGKLTGNKAVEGGNLRVGGSGHAIISKDAVIEQGQGGNITCLGKLDITGGFVGNCVGTGAGNNILTFANLASVNTELTITGGTLNGNIRMGSNSGTTKLTLLGTDIGGTVNVQDGNNTLIVGGKVTDLKVNLHAGQAIGIHEEGLADDSTIIVSVADDTLAIATITDANDEACFIPADAENYKVENKNGDLYLTPKFLHEHCLCGGNAENLGAHTSCETVRWSPWSETDSLPTSGRIVLTEDVHLSAHVNVEKGNTLTICLNGHTITTSEANRVFRVLNGTLNITDCQKDAGGNFKGGIESHYDNSSASGGKVYGGVLYAYNEKGNTPVINIYGGNFTNTGACQSGGLFYLGNAADSTSVATMNLYDGLIYGGYTVAEGGNINAIAGTIFNMYGGKVEGGSASTGGNICQAKASVNLYGGVIADGTARTASGGNINITNNAGNAVYISGTRIQGGEAKGSGGSVNIDGGVVEFVSGSITGGRTQSEGGNIRIGGSGTLNVSGNAEISDGDAKTNGGNLAVFGKLIMTGGTLKDGTAGSLGANISAFANAASAKAEITIDGAVIEGGEIRLGANSGTVKFSIANTTVEDRIDVQSKNVSVTVGGKVTLAEIELCANALITVSADGLDDTSSIGVDMDAIGKFTTITDENDEACFKPVNTALQVVNTDGELSLSNG